MQKEDIKTIIVAIIAVAAIILALFAIIIPKDSGDTKDSENILPTANIFVTNTTVEVMPYVLFDASGSTDSDGTIVEYMWDYGDGVKDSGVFLYHIFSNTGSYTVTLTVVDNDGGSVVETVIITVIEKVQPTNDPPVSSFTVSATTVEVYTSITFNGSSSTDSDGTIIEYTWDFGDGALDSGMYSNHHYSSTGIFTVKLTVTDDEGGSNTSSKSITVTEGAGTPTNTPPMAVIYASETTISRGETVEFNVSESYDPDGTIVEYIWELGDGIHNTGMRVSHEYESSGSYDVNLSVIDDDGAKDTHTITITVTRTTPKAALTFEKESPGRWVGSFYGEMEDPIYFYELNMTITDNSLSQSASQDPLNPGNTLEIPGGMNCTYYDDNSNGRIDGDDTIIIYNGGNYDVIKFIFKPTGGTMAQYTFTYETPTGALSFSESVSFPGNFTGSFISLTAEVYLLEASMIITDDDLAISAEQAPIDSGVTLQVLGGVNCTFTDESSNYKVDPADVIKVCDASPGDQIKFVYIPTGETIATFVFP